MSGTENPDFATRVASGLILLAACGVAYFNGSLWSPFFDSVAHVLHQATRSFPFVTPQRLFYVTPAAMALMTLLVAGIPAAIYERLRGLRSSTIFSLGIWLLATLLLSLPTIMNALSEE